MVNIRKEASAVPPTLRIEHDLHQRRKGRNTGVALLLLGMVAIVFGLTVVKVRSLDNIAQLAADVHETGPQRTPTAPADDAAIASETGTTE